MRTIVILILSCSILGCASFDAFDSIPRVHDPNVAVDVERGAPNQIIDSAGRLVGIPNQLAILDRRIDNHDVSQTTEYQLEQYLRENNLNSILVRVNQYDPVGEWKRLARNRRIRPFWKYSVGTYQLLKYTFLPGRIIGGDWYNPFTDTLNVYSDAPEIAIAEAAYAADVRARLNPGAYASLKEIPFVGLIHETTATEDALSYFERNRSPEEYQAARHVLIPNYGADWGGEVASFFPFGTVIGRVVGGSTARLADRIRAHVAGSHRRR